MDSIYPMTSLTQVFIMTQYASIDKVASINSDCLRNKMKLRHSRCKGGMISLVPYATAMDAGFSIRLMESCFLASADGIGYPES